MYKKDVFKTMTLIMQLGISILVPLFILLYVGIKIKQVFSVDFILVFIIIGLLSGIRNCYVIIKLYLKSLDNDSKSELIKKLKK